MSSINTVGIKLSLFEINTILKILQCFLLEEPPSLLISTPEKRAINNAISIMERVKSDASIRTSYAERAAENYANRIIAEVAEIEFYRLYEYY